MIALERRYVLDAAAVRSRDGLALIGGTPLRLLRLTLEGRDVLEGVLRGEPRQTPAAHALVRRLLDAGLINPAGARPAAAPLTTVVPVRNGAPRLTALVRALLPAGRVIVVDDGSSDGSAEIAAAAGADVVVNPHAAGPAGARNAGLEAADTELVAFVDDDCGVEPGWADHLIALFGDPELAVAAPRVRSAPGPSALARYEARCSPLDLGPHASLVGPGRRLTFVPSAALVARRAALLEVGGFDPQLRVGEDVDLVWRLIAHGWRVRYAPESEVQHEPRGTLRGLVRQRFAYGTSAVPLEARHSGAATPLHITPPTVAVWLAGAAFGPGAASIALGASALRALRHRQSGGLLVALVVRHQLEATRHLARALVREWIPITALAATRSRRLRHIALAAFAVDAAAARAHPALRLVDNAAYSAGLWRAAVAARSAAALTPRRVTASRQTYPDSPSPSTADAT